MPSDKKEDKDDERKAEEGSKDDSEESYDDYDDEEEEMDDYDEEVEMMLNENNDAGRREPIPEGQADLTPLLPWSIQTIPDAIQHFADTFKARYGNNAPNFHIGELKDAAAEAFQPSTTPPARKLLAIYLHNDHAVAHNLFAQNVLCSAEISALLRRNFVVWPWDTTQPRNRERLTNFLDAAAVLSIRNIINRVPESDYPMLIIIEEVRQRRLYVTALLGRNDVGTAFSRMDAAIGYHQEQLKQEAQRVETAKIREQQERDYEAAQRRDKERREAAMRERAEKERVSDEEKRRRAELASLLPPEPDVASTVPCVSIRARFPDGSEAMRTFPSETQLCFVAFWLDSLGYSEERYQFLRAGGEDMRNADQSSSLSDLKYMRREQLMVVESNSGERAP